VDMDTDVHLTGTAIIPFKIPDEMHTALAEALLHRPELAIARRKLAIAQIQKKQIVTTFLPELNFQGRLSFDDENMAYDSHRANWIVGLTLQWALFEGGRRIAQMAKANAYINEMKATDRKTVLQIETEIRKAYLNIRTARQHLTVAKRGLELANENLALTKQFYDNGVVTVSRYLGAQLAHTAAKTRHISAQFDLKRSITEAARSMGWCSEYTDRQEGKTKNE